MCLKSVKITTFEASIIESFNEMEDAKMVKIGDINLSDDPAVTLTIRLIMQGKVGSFNCLFNDFTDMGVVFAGHIDWK